MRKKIPNNKEFFVFMQGWAIIEDQKKKSCNYKPFFLHGDFRKFL